MDAQRREFGSLEGLWSLWTHSLNFRFRWDLPGLMHFFSVFHRQMAPANPGEPNQVPVIHVFFCCGGSSGLLIHAYSWHNRKQERFLSNCSKSRVRGGKSQNPIAEPKHKTSVPGSEFKFRGLAGPPMGALKSDQL